MSFKDVFLFLALAAIMFGGAEPFCEILVVGIIGNIQVQLF